MLLEQTKALHHVTSMLPRVHSQNQLFSVTSAEQSIEKKTPTYDAFIITLLYLCFISTIIGLLAAS